MRALALLPRERLPLAAVSRVVVLQVLRLSRRAVMGVNRAARMSALPPKADVNGYGAGCLLLTQSGH